MSIGAYPGYFFAIPKGDRAYSEVSFGFRHLYTYAEFAIQLEVNEVFEGNPYYCLTYVYLAQF